MRIGKIVLLTFAALATITNYHCRETVDTESAPNAFVPNFLCWGDRDSTLFLYYSSQNDKRIEFVKCSINSTGVSRTSISSADDEGIYPYAHIKGIFSKLDNSIIYNLDGRLVKQSIEGGLAVTLLSYMNSYFYLLNISEDYSKFCFVSNYQGNFDLYIMDYDGYNLRNLTNDSNYEYYGGELSTVLGKVIYTREKEVFIVNLDGSNKTNLSNLPLEREEHELPLFSLHRNKIFFIKRTSGHERILTMMNIDGTGKTEITDTSYKVQRYFISNDAEKLFFEDIKNYPESFKELNINNATVQNVNFCASQPRYFSKFSNSVLYYQFDNYRSSLYMCKNYGLSILLAEWYYQR